MNDLFVRYNGENTRYFPCSDPGNLVIGKLYKVIGKEVYGWQINYILQGVKGQFNSAWFEKVYHQSLVKGVLVSYTPPTVGERLICGILNSNGDGDKVSLKLHHTSAVRSYFQLGERIYQVTTCNSVYIVYVR